jgi:hypothetical protein
MSLLKIHRTYQCFRWLILLYHSCSNCSITLSKKKYFFWFIYQLEFNMTISEMFVICIYLFETSSFFFFIIQLVVLEITRDIDWIYVIVKRRLNWDIIELDIIVSLEEIKFSSFDRLIAQSLFELEYWNR